MQAVQKRYKLMDAFLRNLEGRLQKKIREKSGILKPIQAKLDALLR